MKKMILGAGFLMLTVHLTAQTISASGKKDTTGQKRERINAGAASKKVNAELKQTNAAGTRALNPQPLPPIAPNKKNVSKNKKKKAD